MNKILPFVVSVIVAAATGCGADNSGTTEAVKATEQAFSIASCATASPSVTFDTYLPADYYSPQSYNKCYKSFIYEVSGLQSSWDGGYEQGLELLYGDEPITDQTECEGTELAAILYQDDGSSWVDQTGELRALGVWDGSSCQLWLDTPVLHWGNSYRVAATLRNSAGETRIIRFYWPKNVVT